MVDYLFQKVKFTSTDYFKIIFKVADGTLSHIRQSVHVLANTGVLTLDEHGLVAYRKEHTPENSIRGEQVEVICAALDMMTRTDPDAHRAIIITCIDPDASGNCVFFFKYKKMS